MRHSIAQMVKVILLGMMIYAVIFGISHFRLSQHFHIKTVRVYGANRVDRREVEAMLQPLVNHGFFGVNIETIRERLMQQPWVADIFVRRNWPDQIEIRVVEKTAVARWDETTLLSETGVLFTPNEATLPPDLPLFVGPLGKQVVMLNYFKEINRLLTPLHAKISYLELTPYQTWKMRLDNGITMQIGHKDVLTRLGHFVKVYPKIVGDNAAAVDSIDLRYANGVAVRWKAPLKT